MTSEAIQKAVHALSDARHPIALTGAGISVESGIPDFRSAAGLWSKYSPEEYATIEAFHADPHKVWTMLAEMVTLVTQAKPNPAHVGLANLEEMGKLHTVITQNIDGLHQVAGSHHVIEFHGSTASLSCLSCGYMTGRDTVSVEQLPPTCPRCHSILKPDVVFFGEPIPWDAHQAAMEAARTCDLLLVIGTSAMVYPAAAIPPTAKDCGAKVIEINLEPTPLTHHVSDLIVKGSSGEILPGMVKELRRLTHP
jgi:NAD-dependent deacetylase